MAARQLANFTGPKWRLRGVPVFGYHGLTRGPEAERPARESKYWVREAEFRRQLERIRRARFSPGRLEALTGEAASAEDSANSLILTFDDGLVSQYEIAFPLLVEFQTPAYFFVNTSTVGLAGFLTWDQMLEMQRAGMSFQSHSHEHLYLPWLSAPVLERQLRDSKQILENRLGSTVRFLSAPFGELNRRVVQAAKDVGYQGVCNSRSWPSRRGDSTVNRVAVYSSTTAESFERLMAGDAVSYAARAARERAVYLPKRLLLRLRPSPAPDGSLRAVTEK
ncbi:MAG: polysaccharide deacetylase family protein [Candidatus Acidiferrales bacterium]